MKKWGKIVFSCGLTCSLLFGQMQPFAYADWNNSVHEEKSEGYIAKGVKHEHLLRFTDAGWINIHVIRMDLNEKDASLDLLYNQTGLYEKGKLSEFVNQKGNVVGAVNGDFFSMQSSATVGPMVKNGELISSTYHLTEQVPTFNVSKDQEAFISKWANSQISLVNENSQMGFNISSVNKALDGDNTAILYTPKWGLNTPDTSQKQFGAKAMIVQNDRVTEIRQAQEGVTIPNDGYVVLAAGAYAQQLGMSFVIGDKVVFSANTNPNYMDLDLTIGGGATLVKEGMVQSTFELDIKGNHPRTALGISKDKKEVLLVTVDGRTSSYTGVTQRELGEIMVSLGAYDAINMDGGGSTDMVLRPLGEENKKVINNLSTGSERRIMNGIGVVSTAAKTEEIGGIIIEENEANVLLNTSKRFNIKAYDKNYNPVKIDAAKVKWQVSGVEGRFSQNVFKPTTAGEGVVVAEYNGQYASLPIRVIGQPVKLTLSPSKISIGQNNKQYIKATVVDEEGYKASVNVLDLNLDIPNNLGTMDYEGYFHSSDQATSGMIKASYGDLTAYIPVAVGSKEVVIDEFEKVNGTFLSYPAEVTGSYNLSTMSKFGKTSGELSYDFTTTDATRAAYLLYDNGGLTFANKPEKLGLWVYGNGGGGHTLKAKLVDGNGTDQTITLANSIDWQDWKYVEAILPANIKTPVRLERIYVVETHNSLKDKGKIYIDQLTARYPSTFEGSVPSTPQVIKDSRNVKSELKGENSFKFFAHGSMAGIDPLNVEALSSIANSQAQLNVISGSIDPIKDKLKNETIMISSGNNTANYKNSVFVNLDNSKGSLRETNFEQWRWFLRTAENVNSKNVFITLPKPLSFKDALEEKLFKDTLKKLKQKNIDVWVLTGGQEDFKVDIQEGIRYVGLKSYASVSDLAKFTDPKYMMFTVNEDKVTYEILPLNIKK